MRNSKQRDLVLETLKHNAVHPTADFIYDVVKKQMPAISLATVYRNLKQLSDEGVIKKIEGIDGSMHFDHNIHMHHHFVCKICNQIYDVEGEIIKDVNKDKLMEQGFELLEYEVNLKGICHSCKH